MKAYLFGAIALYSFTSCQQNSRTEIPVNIFTDSPIAKLLKEGVIDEASGIADSRANSGFLWVEQDSGNPPELTLLGYDGHIFKKIYLKNAQNRDWEELALAKGPEPDTYYIYAADIGDNFLQYSDYTIYRFREPGKIVDSIPSCEKITFRYPDGANNAEAMVVDSSTRDIYIITKSNVKSNVYKLSYPQDTSVVLDALLVGSLPFTGVVGAAISPDGREIIIKTYSSLHYWKRDGVESIEQLLKRPAAVLFYRPEIQGEAISFKNDNSGFFTLGEKPPMINSVDLNFYKRN